MDIVVKIASFFKICVPIFVFITAYGLSKKYENQTEKITGNVFSKITIKRYFNMMLPFWTIFIVCTIICNIVGIRAFNDIYGGYGSIWYWGLDFFGLSHSFGTPTLNPTWWYMSLAILLICIMPVIWKCVNAVGFTSFIGTFLILQALGWPMYSEYIVVAILGVCFSKYEVIDKLEYILKCSKVIRILSVFIAGSLIIGCVMIFSEGYYSVVFCIATVVVVFLWQQYFSKIKIIKVIFIFIGKHSMNIFLVHSFISAYFLKQFIYSFEYGIFIFIVLMGLSVGCSYTIILLSKLIRIDIIENKIINKFCKRYL